MTKVLNVIVGAAGLMFIALFLAWFMLNILMGCGMVNDWEHPNCMTPIEMLTGEEE